MNWTSVTDGPVRTKPTSAIETPRDEKTTGAGDARV
jgi:hypothetical protein